MLHVPSTPIPESTGIPEWSLSADEQQHHHHHHHPQQLNRHDNGYFHTAGDNFFFLHQHDEHHDDHHAYHDQHQQQQMPPPPAPPPQLPPPLMEPCIGEDDDVLDEYHNNVTMDATYETATRIFYATMQKFAKQGYHRRSFLESWHLHSMYSKSQQILLGIPNAQSMVFLQGDDFMFTPQLVPQEMEFDWEEQQPLSMADDGVMVMTAPAPEVMDENAWMRQQHPSIMDDEDEDNDDDEVDDDNDNENQHHHHHHHQVVSAASAPTAPDLQLHHHQIDLVNWYRAGNPPPPSTIMEHHDDDDDDLDNNNNNNNNICNETNDNANSYSNRHETLMDNEPPTMDGHVSKQFGEPVEGEEEEEEDQTVEEQPSPKPLCNNGEKGKETIRINPEDYTSSIEKDLSIHDVAEECTTVLSYQSLADIIPLPPPSTTPAHLPPPATAATTTTASSYGSTVAERSLHRHHYQHQQRLLSHQHLRQQQRENKNDLAQRLLQYPILRSSDRLANAVLEAFELAEELASSKASFFGFLLYFVRIWQVLFLCAESLISIRRRSPLPPFHREPRKVSSNDEMV